MSDTTVAAGMALVFIAGLAAGLWLRGWFGLSQDAIRQELGKERRGRRGCEERERELIDQLRKQSAELEAKAQQMAIMREVVAGNLPPDFLARGG